MINVDKALQILDEETPPVVVDKDKLKVWDTICVVCADNEKKRELNCSTADFSLSLFCKCVIPFPFFLSCVFSGAVGAGSN